MLPAKTSAAPTGGTAPASIHAPSARAVASTTAISKRVGCEGRLPVSPSRCIQLRVKEGTMRPPISETSVTASAMPAR